MSEVIHIKLSTSDTLPFIRYPSALYSAIVIMRRKENSGTSSKLEDRSGRSASGLYHSKSKITCIEI